MHHFRNTYLTNTNTIGGYLIPDDEDNNTLPLAEINIAALQLTAPTNLSTVSIPYSYRYGFNGQEREHQLNQSITSAEYWFYDGRLGRRWNVDPLTYPWQSPYAAFNNCPIYYADPLGLLGENTYQLSSHKNFDIVTQVISNTTKEYEPITNKENESFKKGLINPKWVYPNDMKNNIKSALITTTTTTTTYTETIISYDANGNVTSTVSSQYTYVDKYTLIQYFGKSNQVLYYNTLCNEKTLEINHPVFSNNYNSFVNICIEYRKQNKVSFNDNNSYTEKIQEYANEYGMREIKDDAKAFIKAIVSDAVNAKSKNARSLPRGLILATPGIIFSLSLRKGLLLTLEDYHKYEYDKSKDGFTNEYYFK